MKRIGDLIGQTYRKWEQTGEVCVFSTEGVQLNDLDAVVSAINDVIDVFKLPLQAVNGNAVKSEDVSLVERLINSNVEVCLIDSDSIMNELRSHKLLYGLVVLVNHQRYGFKNNPSDPEPAIYGWSDYEGLSILRRFDIKNAVRHEFGHMIGLGNHHPNCVMDWHCPINGFCSACKSLINELWELS